MKKFLSLVLVFAMLCSLIVINVSAAEVSVWDGSASEYLKGSGTKDDPYLIQSAADLKYFADTTNAGTKYTGKYIVQTVDIDLNNLTWTPISWKDVNAFTGVYDGQGHTISNMLIDQNLAGGPALGLFGYMKTSGADAGVTNLTLTGAITAAQARVGGLVGQIHGRNHVNDSYKVYITNVVSDVDITLENYTTTGGDIDAKSYWGGVAGFAAVAVFENVKNMGSISATNCNANHPVGGIVGRASMSDFISCVNEGNVTLSTNNLTKYSYSTASAFVNDYDVSSLECIPRAGGIVGLYIKTNTIDRLNFVNCVNVAAVDVDQTHASSSNRGHAGGILGSVMYLAKKVNYTGNGTMCNDYNITFSSCANTGAVTSHRSAGGGETNAGGILGTLYQGTHGKAGSGSTTNNAVNVKFYNCVNVGTVDGSSGSSRSAAMFGILHNAAGVAYDIIVDGCKSGNTTDYPNIANGKVIGNFTNVTVSGTSCSFGAEGNNAGALVTTNQALVVPSYIDINGFDTAEDVSVWNGTSANTFLLGQGTATDPYLIRNANDLKGLANMVNKNCNSTTAYGNTFAGKYVKQIVDIDLNNKEWQPIGYRGVATFQGVYDGDNHTVSGLTHGSTINYRNGLFGALGTPESHYNSNVYDATHELAGQLKPDDDQVVPALTADCGIANLNLVATFTLNAAHGGVFGVGALVGHINSEDYAGDYKVYITNVTTTVAMTVSGFAANIGIGGVAGEAYHAVFENVTTKGSLSVTGNQHCFNPTGGIVGKASSCEFISCTNSGAVTFTTPKSNDIARAGGLVGLYHKKNAAGYLTFENCVNNAPVTLTVTANPNTNRVHAGGILGSLWYNTDFVTNSEYDSTINGDFGKTYAKYDLSFYNCVNTAKGVVSATNGGTGEVNAGGIIGTLHHGYNSADNNAGNIVMRDCVNMANIYATAATGGTGRAAGIAGCIYTRGAYTFGTVISNCLTAPGLTGGSTVINLLGNPKPIPAALYNTSVAASDYADDLEAWNKSLMAPSTININNMPTAKVAVLTGVKNEVVDLPYAVPATMVVVDANGNKVTNITAAGEYTVKLALLGVTPYVTAEYALKYTIAYENDFLTDDADLLVANYGAVIRNFAKAFNNFSTYGKTEAAVADITYSGILPQDLNKVFTMTIVDGEETLLTFDYSLATYSFNQLERTHEELGITPEEKEALDNFLIDKLKYAAVVQGIKGQTENLATDGLSAEQLGLGSSFSAAVLDSVKGVTNVVDDDVLTWTAAALVYNDNITIRLRFATDADLANYEFKVFVGGVEYTDFEVKGAYINVNGFAPTMYADTVTAYLVDSEDNQVSDTVSYSVNSYIVNKCEDAVDGPLVQALACYAASAQKYLSYSN